MNLTGTPYVTLTYGTAFTVTQPASTTLSAGAATTFTVTFDPSAAGSFTDTVNIANNDADENPYTFVISGTGVANNPPTYTLTVNITGNGRVDLDPIGTNGSGTVNFASVYTAGTVVTMTATPDSGWRFDGWSGDASGTAAFPLLMDGNKAVTATFIQYKIYLPLVMK